MRIASASRATASTWASRPPSAEDLKAAVTRADWYDPDLNPKLEEFCRHYGTVLLPTRSYTPRHKGKVESGVGYAQCNALKGRSFGSISEQNRFLLQVGFAALLPGIEGDEHDGRVGGSGAVDQIYDFFFFPGLLCFRMQSINGR